MNGNVADTSNLNNTMMRGFQRTDNNGIVAFNTMMPGHYPIRANHVHGMYSSSKTSLSFLTCSQSWFT
jgi:protocatechuate 3,4-dioxygenase beta subunit